MKSIAIAAALGIVALVGAAAVRGDVAYNTFGAGDDYYNGNGFILYGPESAIGARINGFRFVAAASGRITRLVVPLRHVSDDNSYTFEIYSDGAGGAASPPGASLGAVATAAGLMWSNPPAPPPVQIDAGGSLVLTSGMAYWLVARGNGTAHGSWFQNNQGIVGPRIYGQSMDSWNVDTQPIGAFRIEVTPVCPADYDRNGLVQPADVSLFVSTWFASLTGGTLVGDFDGNSAVEPADVSLFVATWFNAVANGC